MPMTGRMLQELSGKASDSSLAVSEVVARGAAIHAGIVAARMGQEHGGVADLLGDVVEINVNAHSLGIEVKQGEERLNDILVAKNTLLPTSATRIYRTVVENQPGKRVKVLQGEAPQAESCISIGERGSRGCRPSCPSGRRSRSAAASPPTASWRPWPST